VEEVHRLFKAGGGTLVDGYAPFCKHVFVKNFVGGCCPLLLRTEGRGGARWGCRSVPWWLPTRMAALVNLTPPSSPPSHPTPPHPHQRRQARRAGDHRRQPRPAAVRLHAAAAGGAGGADAVRARRVPPGPHGPGRSAAATAPALRRALPLPLCAPHLSRRALLFPPSRPAAGSSRPRCSPCLQCGPPRPHPPQPPAPPLPPPHSWFPEAAVQPVPEAAHLDLILYSREQLVKEYRAMPTKAKEAAVGGPHVPCRPQPPLAPGSGLRCPCLSSSLRGWRGAPSACVTPPPVPPRHVGRAIVNPPSLPP
jgi:hypothetical protein